MGGTSNLGEVDGACGGLFLFLCQLGARSEVLEKAHDASVPHSGQSIVCNMDRLGCVAVQSTYLLLGF